MARVVLVSISPAWTSLSVSARASMSASLVSPVSTQVKMWASRLIIWAAKCRAGPLPPWPLMMTSLVMP